MPELPEVETVKNGLAPVMEGAVINRVMLRRKSLRYPFPDQFAERLTGARILDVRRRGKYIQCVLSTDEVLIIHLGMSGRVRIHQSDQHCKPGAFTHDPGDHEAHNHVELVLTDPDSRIVYNDPRRFGFMDLALLDRLSESRHFASMGPEPLGRGFTVDHFNERLIGRSAPIKSVLLDQRVVAGIGNIYACEALFRARISPRRQAASVAGKRAARLHEALRAVLRDAIAAGGSSLKDYSSVDGSLGYFQHRFDVYGKIDDECTVCGTVIKRINQSGRSTFYCPNCQR